MSFFKTRLIDYSNENVTTYLVDGSSIRDPLSEPFDIDFTEGGNDMADDGFRTPLNIPPGEVWIDLDVAPTEVRATILHELTERRVMIEQGLVYEEAHVLASQAETNARSHMEEIDSLLAEELAKAPKYPAEVIVWTEQWTQP